MCEAEKEAMAMFPLDAKNMFPAAGLMAVTAAMEEALSWKSMTASTRLLITDM